VCREDDVTAGYGSTDEIHQVRLISAFSHGKKASAHRFHEMVMGGEGIFLRFFLPPPASFSQ
jgi:hypothetical protein